MDRARTFLVAEVMLSERNGSIHAYSDDIPGLNICGADRDDVLKDVIEGIKYLYKHVHGMIVDVEWADSPASLFKPQTSRKGIEHFVMKPTFAQLAA